MHTLKGWKYGSDGPKSTTVKMQNEAVQFLKTFSREKLKLTWSKQENVNKCAFPRDY